MYNQLMALLPKYHLQVQLLLVQYHPENPNERWLTDPHANLPTEPMEREMTVLEAEQSQKDDSL